MVDCHTTAAKCRGLSFCSLPRKNVTPEQDKWRERLIHLIDRVDKKFNPDTAKICSRHFEPSCLKYGPSGKCTGLVTDSLPTHWMPTKSIVTPKTSRPDPTEREPPSVPERVFYLNFGDLSKDVTAVAPPWVVKENSATVYMIGLPSDSGWRIFVSLTTETGLIAHVKVSGFPVPHLAQNLEKKRLKSFLADLLQMTDCTGVTEPTLQEFAGPPDDKTVSMLANQTGSEEYRQQMTLTFSNSSHGERRESARASYPVHRGTYDLLDECCRTHAHCDTSISPSKYKYGKFNWYIWTISLCDCDDTFKQCMRNVTRGPQKGAAQTVDFIYFRLLGIKCFTLNDKGKAVMRS
ncbi:uncharacterized protein [Littorina saxatilis]|uniref:uncharacterized protein isoform X2 n=1 Tax=Littorina saxatilis TaxID=31220 RepID=UPI0038B58CC7